MVCKSIVLAERYPGLLWEIRKLLASEADAVLMAVDEVSIMKAVEKVIPDLVIADLSLAVSGGTNLVKSIKQYDPSIKVIILSIYEDPSMIEEISNNGADGFVLKQRAATDLIPAVREVCQGGRYVPVDRLGG